ncbi:MAG: ABC transporter ATP-binding protein [Burkholderiales bacterium]|nr:ABC transporter ATP-binding protein [Burkholderiales bacterium]
MSSAAPASSPVLHLKEIRQAYGSHVVVDNLSLQLPRGRIACLLGPSGCGKTTVLRTIAGFEPLLDGEIDINGRLASRRGFTQPPEQRRIGMVFQDYALFPHLTVAANIAFGLRSLSRHTRQQRVAEMLEVVGLTGAGSKYPHQLSGGQQQRIALARALAPRPDLLLLDEPFSNLDVDLRERLSLEVRSILKAQNATAILVTHDQHEAFAIADEIGVMNGGRIEQWDTAYNLYHQPVSRFVADFVGQGVLMPGTMSEPKKITVEMGVLESSQPLPCWAAAANGQPMPVDVLLRPDDIVHDDASPVQAEVLHKAFRGAEILYTLRLSSGGKVLSLVPSHHNHAIGERIGIRVEIDHLVVFPQNAR